MSVAERACRRQLDKFPESALERMDETNPPWKSHYSRRWVRYLIAKARLFEAAWAPCIGGYVRVEA